MTFIDRKDNRVRQLFNMELIRAETKWYSFYQKNHRPPDYNFLQEEITSFGVNRLPMFDRRNEGRVNDELSVDNFVHYHIQQLKLEKILSPVFFEKNDLRFMERYAKNKAKAYFNERDQYIKGYESFRISRNKIMQQAGYEQLKYEFVSDNMVQGYFKEEVAKMAANDERVAEFVFDEGKSLMRSAIHQLSSISISATTGTTKAVTNQIKKQRTTGKQRYNQLKKHGALEHIDVSKTDLKPLTNELKKYKVDFAVKRNKETGKIHVFFKAQDRDTLNLALENVLQKFTNEKEQNREQQQERPNKDIEKSSVDDKDKDKSLTKKLDKLEDKAQEINQQREQLKENTKNKTKGQER
ncbi:PcfB family protein [Enterococcus hirae]|nr:PcfB family protein [Enterococcus hirae]